MKIVTCRFCGGEILSSEKICPLCRHERPYKNPYTEDLLFYGVILLVVLIFGGAIVQMFTRSDFEIYLDAADMGLPLINNSSVFSTESFKLDTTSGANELREDLIQQAIDMGVIIRLYPDTAGGVVIIGSMWHLISVEKKEAVCQLVRAYLLSVNTDLQDGILLIVDGSTLKSLGEYDGSKGLYLY